MPAVMCVVCLHHDLLLIEFGNWIDRRVSIEWLPLCSKKGKAPRHMGSTKLPVSECSPEVPAGDGSEGPPMLRELLDISSIAVDVLHGSFETNIPKFCVHASPKWVFPCTPWTHSWTQIVRLPRNACGH